MEDFIGIIADSLEKDKESIQPTDRFRNYDEWDSFASLSVLLKIHENYDVVINRTSLEQCSTIMELFHKVQEQKTS